MVWISKMWGWEGATCLDVLFKNDQSNKDDIILEKRQLEIYFYSNLNSIVIENACHLSKSPIRMYKKYTVCVHVHNLHPGVLYPHSLGRRFRYDSKFWSKRHETWQKRQERSRNAMSAVETYRKLHDRHLAT